MKSILKYFILFLYFIYSEKLFSQVVIDSVKIKIPDSSSNIQWYEYQNNSFNSIIGATNKELTVKKIGIFYASFKIDTCNTYTNYFITICNNIKDTSVKLSTRLPADALSYNWYNAKNNAIISTNDSTIKIDSTGVFYIKVITPQCTIQSPHYYISQLNCVINNTPIANHDQYKVFKNQTLSGGNVLSNDSDPDGDPLTVTLINNVTVGTLTLNTNGTFTYVADPTYTGIVRFEYQVCDNKGACNTATASITIEDPCCVLGSP